MSKHSTGPWKFEEGQPKIFTTWNGKDYVVASVEESRLGWHEDRLCESSECGANAKLIAAAPELLTTLKKAVDAHDYDGREGWVADAKAAIAKAEGRS